ncbi:MAG: MBL fold metallo-hydrolase [Anaerolineae bacterium]
MLTILYDNYPYDDRLRTSWGFSCLVERGGLRVLFDTGGDSPTLLANMEALGVDPGNLDAIVLSHIHGDHVGGLDGVLSRNEDTVVYVPQSFPLRFKDDVRSRAGLVEVGGPMRIAEGVRTTGELGGAIKEQALIVSSAEGVIVITGCAHPGVVNIVAKAKEVSGEPIELVMGGFHLSGTGQAGIRSIVDDFQELGVHRVAPTHCSGDLARRMFKEAYGDAFVSAGAGLRLEIEQ